MLLMTDIAKYRDELKTANESAAQEYERFLAIRKFVDRFWPDKLYAVPRNADFNSPLWLKLSSRDKLNPAQYSLSFKQECYLDDEYDDVLRHPIFVFIEKKAIRERLVILACNGHTTNICIDAQYLDHIASNPRAIDAISRQLLTRLAIPTEPYTKDHQPES